MDHSIVWEGNIPSCKAVPFLIKHARIDRRSHVQEIDMHTHREFELYVNLTGDISFLVEDRLHALSRGDVFFARPGEHHHCVYHSDAPHEYFWILFDGDTCKDAVSFLFDDPARNTFFLSDEGKEELIELCSSLLRQNLPDGERNYAFWRLLHLLKLAAHDPLRAQNNLPEDLSRMLTFVEEHVDAPLTVASISKALYISQSSIERRFKDFLGLTPLAYIHKRKLQAAATLLRGGSPVSAAALAVGYTDTSYFIRLFERHYGITPHRYKEGLSCYTVDKE